MKVRERMLADARKAAHAMLKTLGEMKGVPLKLGQMASYIDGLAPPGYEEKFQRVLTKLQEKAEQERKQYEGFVMNLNIE